MTLQPLRATPCRADRAARPHPHACSASHAYLVTAYRDARAAWEAERDAACGGYAGDEALWTLTHPGPTFRTWLLAFQQDAMTAA